MCQMSILVRDGVLPDGLGFPRRGLTGEASGGEKIAVTRRQVPLQS